MNGPVANRISGNRLHLQHGPIDLIIGAEGQREAAFEAARERFTTILEELVAELPFLRQGSCRAGLLPQGSTARRMVAAVRPHAVQTFITPMAAVAGSVADEVLAAMTAATSLDRAFVNNGGDIAIHLSTGRHFDFAMAGIDGRALGQARIACSDPVRGLATSGRHGRSFSFGIADSVTVLARNAAAADAAATVIANAVDLPGHPLIDRVPACTIDDRSDLQDRLVVTACAPLPRELRKTALNAGLVLAEACRARGLISHAALFLQGDAVSTRNATLRIEEKVA